MIVHGPCDICGRFCSLQRNKNYQNDLCCDCFDNPEEAVREVNKRSIYRTIFVLLFFIIFLFCKYNSQKIYDIIKNCWLWITTNNIHVYFEIGIEIGIVFGICIYLVILCLDWRKNGSRDLPKKKS